MPGPAAPRAPQKVSPGHPEGAEQHALHREHRWFPSKRISFLFVLDDVPIVSLCQYVGVCTLFNVCRERRCSEMPAATSRGCGIPVAQSTLPPSLACV